LSTSRRKSPNRISGAAVVIAIVVAFLYGWISTEKQLPPYSILNRAYGWVRYQPRFHRAYLFLREHLTHEKHIPGRWRPIATPTGADHLTEQQRDEIARLQALGYLSGSRPSRGLRGVTVYEPALAYRGTNLVTSGHAAEAYLMDMRGHVLHRWECDWQRAFPELGGFQSHATDNPDNLEMWRRAYLYDNGDLLAIYHGFGMIKLNRDSELIWARAGGFHHDMFVHPEGDIYALTREAKMLPRIHPIKPTLEDYIEVFDPDGNALRKLSVLEVFERSRYASFLASIPGHGDILHTNTIEVLNGRHAGIVPAFERGNILISVRHTNVIAVVDMTEEKIVWALSGQWQAQHEPAFLENGNILLFDNQGHFGMSKVIEIDPLTQKIEWSYEGTAESPFFSETCGANQRLPNGNTLIIESDAGRAFEVTPDKRIVWEYYNPARAGDNNDLIATLYEVVRLDSTFGATWLKNPGDTIPNY
jgi:hypothetical protein